MINRKPTSHIVGEHSDVAQAEVLQGGLERLWIAAGDGIDRNLRRRQRIRQAEPGCRIDGVQVTDRVVDGDGGVTLCDVSE